jgi:hypothetical protein
VQLVSKFNEGYVPKALLMNQLEVLLAMMEKVKLKKENYISLMKGLKVFIDDPSS